MRQAYTSRRTSSYVIWIWGPQKREVVGDWRGSNCCRHQGIAFRRQCRRGYSQSRRGCIGSGQTPQGAHKPGISCPVESLSFGGHGQRSWRQMVVGSLGVLATVSKGEGANRDPLMRRCVLQAWKLRFVAIMSCAAVRAVASSLLELRGHGGADGVVPFFFHEVDADFRHAHLE